MSWQPEPGERFSSERVRIGRFRRHPSEPGFTTGGQVQRALLVFPRLPVRIAQAGRRAVVADPTLVMLYNPRQEYSRAAVSPEGDRCDWFAFDAGDVGGEQPFSQPCVQATAPLVMRARALFAAASAAHPDPFFVEEEALGLLASVLSREAAPPRAHSELVAAALELLARRYSRAVRVSHLAAALGCSPFHLCRVFRAATSRTLHQHLTALRLHAALEQIEGQPRDLAMLALELGFSHHAHLTASFRRAYGVTPSGWRRRLRQLEDGAARS